MRSLSLLALLLTAASPAAAQDTDSLDLGYYPLEVGDTWEYSLYIQQCDSQECDSGSVYFRRSIVGEVEVEGVRYAEMQVEQFDSTTGSVTCESMHNVRVNPETALVEITGLPGCYGFARAPLSGLVEDEIPLTIGTPAVEPVRIGDIEYDLEARTATDDDPIPCPDTCYTQFARKVGLIVYEAYSDALPGSQFDSFRLRYAEVDGVVYGLQVVSNEEVAPTQTFQLTELYPNPFRTTATLTLSLPSPESVTLAVFDVLGRRVLTRDLGVQPAGESRHALDGSRLPAGVYFVRATTASGQQATRRVVRIE